MWFHSLLASWKSGRSRGRRPQQRPARRGTRLFLEHLEDRMVPSNYYSAASVADLIADITAANTAGGANTIQLTAATTAPYVLTAVNNTTNGSTGLPVIAANDNLTIVGNGDTIERSTAAGTPDFRLLKVASGSSLTLENLTLQGGMIGGDGVHLAGLLGAAGAGIYTQGTLVLNGVTVQDNVAGFSGTSGLNSNGINAAGGGICSSGGSVTLEGGTIVQYNEALGTSTWVYFANGGNAYGGGLYASSSTVTVTNATLDNNTAVGGQALLDGFDGSAFGGGLYASGGKVNLTNATLDGNALQVNSPPTSGGSNIGGYGHSPSHGIWFAGGSWGAGLYLAGGAATVTNCTVQGNSALGNIALSEGGGLYLSRETATVTNCTVQGNSALSSNSGPAEGEGGGLYIAGGVVTLQGDIVESNSASSHGGGLYSVSTATVHLDSFTVANTINNTDSTGINGSTANIDGTVLSPLAPTVVNAASANPSPVTGTTTNLSVLGNDAAGASSLDYTWAVTSAPAGAAAPTFSSNGSNASQNTTATFYSAGTYTFQVTLTGPYNLTVVSSVTVTVVQTVSSLGVTPANVTLADGATQQFTATALDQFGQALAAQPTFTWQVSRGGGTISGTGLYTAPRKGTGTFQVTVSAGGLNAQANVTVEA